MISLYDVVLGFDPLDRVEGAISTFLNADWAGAWRKAGPLGLLTEVVACLTAHNAPTIYVSRVNTRGADVERLLKHYGVKVWDRGAWENELYFCVKRRQVKWAEYVLTRAGIATTRTQYEPRNAQWAAQHAGAPIPHNARRPR